MATKRVLEERLRRRNEELAEWQAREAKARGKADLLSERIEEYHNRLEQAQAANHDLRKVVELANVQVGVLESQLEKTMDEVSEAHGLLRQAERAITGHLAMYNTLAEELRDVRNEYTKLHTSHGQKVHAIEGMKREYLKLYYRSKSWTKNVLPFSLGMLFTAAIVVSGVMLGV